MRVWDRDSLFNVWARAGLPSALISRGVGIVTSLPRVAITGATGFVGCNVVRRLLQDGHDVHALVRPGYQAWRIEDLRSDLRLHAVDLRDRDAVQSTLRSLRPDWVLHLAVNGAYPDQDDLSSIVQTNVVGTANLVEACIECEVEVLVHTGSSSEYGVKDHAPREDESLEPNSYYAVTKAASTLLCRFAARRAGIRMPTLRLYSVYGPFEEPSRLIPSVIVHGLSGSLPPLAGPDTGRDFVFVDEFVQAVLLAAGTPAPDAGAVWNVGSGRQTTLREVVELARRTLDIAEEPAWNSGEARRWDTPVWVSNSAGIERDLGWRATTALERGLQQTIDWLCVNPDLLAMYERRSLRRIA